MDYLETDALSGLRAREPFQSTFLSVVNEIPQLPEPSALLRKGIKLGTKLLANRKFLGALYGLGTFRESTGAPRKERRRKRKPEKVERRPFPDEGASREVLLAWIQTELHWRQCGSSRLMGLMDEDRSGAATFNEFTQGLNAAGVAELKRGDAMRLFKAIDISGNLSISIAELTQTLFTRNYNEEPEEKEAVDPWGDGPRPEVLENPLKGVHPSYPNAPTRRPAGESKHGPSPLEARSKGGRPRRQQGPARPSAVARENAKTETRGGRGGGARVGSMADFPPTFWEDLGRKLPTARDPATRKRRMDMFSAFDPNGNGYLSLAEVDRGITQALDCQQLFDAKPVIMRAFQAAKYAHSTKSKLGADYVERIEFRLLLVYLRRYFELFVMFDAIDGNDRRIDRGEFLAALPKIAEWGVTLADAGAEFDSIDTNGGGSILFDEFCAWALAKELDLVEDDGAEEDHDVDVPLVSSASAARAGAAATRAALNRSSEGGEGKINRDAGPAMTNEDWARLGGKLPTGKDPATRKRRMDMFSAFDPNGNGYLSLAEVDRGITLALDCQQLFDAKPAIMRAFQAAKHARSTKAKLGADYVERAEFRLLLVYLRRYFELFVMFDAIDGDDRRIDRGEFSTALSKIAEWGVVVADAGAEFDSIDTNGGGSILFDEFCAWALAKELDLVEDDDAEEDQDVDVPLVSSASAARAGAAATRAALNRSTEGGEGKINRDAGPAMTNEDWARLGEKLPTGKDPATRKRRMDMFSAFDPNGNGYLSLAEVDKGITEVLDCQQLLDAKPAIMRAFQAAKNARSTKSKLGADYVERAEFRLLLVYLRRYFELFVMFDAIDGNDRRIDRGEFSTALSKIAEWGVVVADAGAEFDSIDTNGGGSILFDEFCAWALAKELDLVEDDDAEEDQDVDVPLVTSAEGSRG